MQNLETEKEERKAHEQEVIAKEQEEHRQKEERGEKIEDDEETSAHKPRKVPKGKTRMVTDPTTGRQIEVEDQDEESMETVKSPTVLSFLALVGNREERDFANGFDLDDGS